MYFDKSSIFSPNVNWWWEIGENVQNNVDLCSFSPEPDLSKINLTTGSALSNFSFSIDFKYRDSWPNSRDWTNIIIFFAWIALIGNFCPLKTSSALRFIAAGSRDSTQIIANHQPALTFQARCKYSQKYDTAPDIFFDLFLLFTWGGAVVRLTPITDTVNICLGSCLFPVFCSISVFSATSRSEVMLVQVAEETQ